MTSKISFFNICKENIKRRIWLLVLTSLTFFISMPLTMMIILQNDVSYGEITEGEMQGIFSGFFGMGFNSFLAAAFAIICAVAGFSWLYSKKKVDLFHSVPVKREKMFAACYVNGIVLYVVPYLVSCLICLIIVSRYMAITGSLLSMAAITFFVHILFFLLFYNVMLVAVMLTGNMISCLITGGVLFVYAMAVRTLLEAYLSYFVVTHYENWSLDKLRFSSPLLTIIDFAGRFVGHRENVMFYLTGGSFALYLLQCIVLTVLTGALALLLYKNRPSEAAGRSIAFTKILHWYRILLVIPLSLGSGIFFSVLVNAQSGVLQAAWMCFGLIFGLVLSHGFIEVLFQMDIRGMFSYKRQLLGTGIVVFLIAFSIRGDWYGFNRSMPKEKDVRSIAVYIPVIDEGNVYMRDTGGGALLSGTDEYIFENMELTSEGVYELAEKGAEYAGKNNWEQSDNVCFVYFVVKFNMKNGKEIYKRYWLDAEKAYPFIEEIYDSEEYKAVMLKRFRECVPENVTITDVEYNDMELEKRWIPEFLEIYEKEYETLTLEQIDESNVEAFMDFNCMDQERGIEMRGRSIPIYGACKDTVRFLREHGGGDLLLDVFDAERIERIQIIIYDKETEEADGHKITVTDKEKIRALTPYLRNYRYISLLGERDAADYVDVFVDIKNGGEKYSIASRFLAGSPWREIAGED